MRKLKLLTVLGLVLTAFVVAVLFVRGETAHADQAFPKKIVLIGGQQGNTAGTHAHSSGIRVLETILNSSPDLQALKVQVEAYPDGWPADETVLENAAAVVWYSPGAQNHPLVNADRRARFERLLREKNIGLVALHQASTLSEDDTSIPLSDWLGGARYGLFDRTIETVAFQPTDHPIWRGVGPFTLWEEFYPTIRFQPGARVVPILPGTFHVEIEHGKPIPLRIERDKTAAWAYERSNGGRGFAFTGLHFLVSFDHPQLRRLLLNATAWAAGIEVPSTGIRSGVPDAATTMAAAVGYKPTPRPAPRALRTAMTEAVVTRASDHQVLPQPWGELTWYVSRELKNSDTMTVGRAVIRPGQQNPRHYHPNCDEILHVLQGHIVHTMNDVTVEMRAGDVVSIPTGAIHNARNIGTEDAILAISFSSADRVAVGYE